MCRLIDVNVRLAWNVTGYGWDPSSEQAYHLNLKHVSSRLKPRVCLPFVPSYGQMIDGVRVGMSRDAPMPCRSDRTGLAPPRRGPSAGTRARGTSTRVAPPLPQMHHLSHTGRQGTSVLMTQPRACFILHHTHSLVFQIARCTTYLVQGEEG